jgi:restriction endonuclease S subunit
MRRNIENTSYRLDAEYYQLVFLQAENKLKFKEWDYLSNLSETIKSFGAYSLCNQVEYLEKGVPFLRCKDIKDGRIDFSDVLYISHDSNRLLWKSEVKPKTVLFTMSGTVGNSAIATEEIKYPINSNQDIAKIVTNERLNPYFFSVFLQSSYGQNQVYRLPVGSVQQHIFLWQLEKLVVPEFHAHFQNYIERVFKLSLSCQRESIDFYNQAQSLLLSDLGLSNWQPKRRLHFVKNYSDTEKAGRIDAEYFQPKYDEIVKAIKGYPGGWDTLENLCELVGHPSNPPYADTQDKNKTFIVTQKHLGDYSLNDEFRKDDDALFTTDDFLKKNSQYKLREEDVLLYSVGAYIGKANIFKGAIKATIGSFLTLLRVKRELLNPYYLMVFLNTDIGVMISKQHQRGMAQQYLYPYDIRTFPVPLLENNKQQQIQEKIIESFNLRKQSKHLIECAKRAVEIAIEQNEDTAIKWLQTQIKEAGHGG